MFPTQTCSRVPLEAPKKGRDPISLVRGRPRGRSSDSSPSWAATSAFQETDPNGCPRWMLRRTASASKSGQMRPGPTLTRRASEGRWPRTVADAQTVPSLARQVGVGTALGERITFLTLNRLWVVLGGPIRRLWLQQG